MNSIHSALVTQRRASLKGRSSSSWQRAFVVVGEAVAVMADVVDAAVERDEIERQRLAHDDARARLAISRLERLRGEQAQNIGEQQLLMLLLVIDAELDQLCRLLRKVAVEQPAERLVDVSAICAHLFGRGTREQPALGARLARADALVIGVEAIFEALFEHAVAAQEALQQERLEEPRRVREMPLGRARVVIGLRQLVLVRKRLGERAG